MSLILAADISAYLDELLLLKAERDLVPLNHLVLWHQNLLSQYPKAMQQIQILLVPKARLDYQALSVRLKNTLEDLKKFNTQLMAIQSDSRYWSTVLEWEAILASTDLTILPYDALNKLKQLHQQKKQDFLRLERDERERLDFLEAEQQRIQEELEAEQRRIAAELEAEQHRISKLHMEKEEKRLRQMRAALIVCIYIFLPAGCIYLFSEHGDPRVASVVSNNAVESEATSPIVKKIPPKTNKRVQLEDYLRGIENGCDISQAPKALPDVVIYNDDTYTATINEVVARKYPKLFNNTIPTIKDTGDSYFEVIATINGVFYGLNASKMIRGYGKSNGIHFLTIVFDDSDAESKLKKQLNFIMSPSELYADKETGAEFNVQDGKTYLTCDWSD